MATSTLQAQTTGTDTIIAGYFPSGEDAHRAIHALLDAGFSPAQIGAAFRGADSADNRAAGVLGGNSMRAELGTTVTPYNGSDNTVAGAASDDSAVQPAGIATGSGSPFVGVGKPGPISGSELEHTGLRSELAHELPTTTPHATSSAYSTATPPAPQSSATRQPAQKEGASWGEKLKHLFQSKPETDTTSAPSSESQNFGTGEGGLGVAPTYGHRYSPTEFERTVNGVGVSPQHSQHVSLRLSTGGAVVTVQAAGRIAEVERIIEANRGYVRFENSAFADPLERDALTLEDESSRIEVFGHLEHIYPNYNR